MKQWIKALALARIVQRKPRGLNLTIPQCTMHLRQFPASHRASRPKWMQACRR